MTSSLSDTLAPPRIATNGRSGDLERLAQILDLGRHQEPGRRLVDVMDDAFGGGVRAVRRSERVVDVHVGQRRQRAGERRVVLFFLRVEPQVLEQDDAAACRPRSSPRGRSPTQSGANATGRSMSCDEMFGHRLAG